MAWKDAKRYGLKEKKLPCNQRGPVLEMLREHEGND